MLEPIASAVKGMGKAPIMVAAKILGFLVREYNIPPEIAVVKSIGMTVFFPVTYNLCQVSFGLCEIAIVGTPDIEMPKATPANKPVDVMRTFSAFII
jgi:hypothetical protein